MLNKFITVLIIEISTILVANKNFFEGNKEAKEKILAEFKVPKSVKAYLVEVTELELVQDLRGITQLIKNSPVNIEDNKLAIAITNFLVNNFANDLYSLPLDYFKLNYKDQQESIANVIPSNSPLANSLKEILTDYSYQEILSTIQLLAEKTLGAPLVLIQSPCEIELNTKKEIRDNLNQTLQKSCLPVFQINKNLIGGLRIFINGKVTDFSWLGRINLFTSLK